MIYIGQWLCFVEWDWLKKDIIASQILTEGERCCKKGWLMQPSMINLKTLLCWRRLVKRLCWVTPQAQHHSVQRHLPIGASWRTDGVHLPSVVHWWTDNVMNKQNSAPKFHRQQRKNYRILTFLKSSYELQIWEVWYAGSLHHHSRFAYIFSFLFLSTPANLNVLALNAICCY